MCLISIKTGLGRKIGTNGANGLVACSNVPVYSQVFSRPELYKSSLAWLGLDRPDPALLSLPPAVIPSLYSFFFPRHGLDFLFVPLDILGLLGGVMEPFVR